MKARRYLHFLRRGLVHAGPPLHLTLFVTGRCNLRCRHCFHWKEVADSTPGPPLERIEALAASSERMGPLLWVSLGGGEPFLRRDLPEIARAFGSRGLRHLAIPTNGLVERQHEALERMAVENPDTFVSVAVSIDGPPGVHDAIRALEGAHEKALAAVRGFQRLAEGRENLGVGLILTVTRENQDVLAAHLEELALELRPDNVTINLARGDALDRELLEVDVGRYREVVATKKRLLAEGKLPYFAFPLVEETENEQQDENKTTHSPFPQLRAKGISSFNDAQLRSGKELTDWLRVKYNISQNNCVPHGIVSVNPAKMLIGYHLDLSQGFPFAKFGLSDKYREPLPSMVEFGFNYDSYFEKIFNGDIWPGIHHSEEILKQQAWDSGMSSADYRKSLQLKYVQYTNWKDEQLGKRDRLVENPQKTAVEEGQQG